MTAGSRQVLGELGASGESGEMRGRFQSYIIHWNASGNPLHLRKIGDVDCSDSGVIWGLG